MSRHVEVVSAQNTVNDRLHHQECSVQLGLEYKGVKFAKCTRVDLHFVNVDGVDLHIQSHVLDQHCESEISILKSDGGSFDGRVGSVYDVEVKAKSEKGAHILVIFGDLYICHVV